MTSTVRTRFAPSPTGDLHLGNLRIAVFNHLFARHHDGAFVIRLEDTDVERNRPEAIERILADLRWAGLDWDEGPDRDGPFGPYRQSQRGERHRNRAEELYERGSAYPCFCKADEALSDRQGPPGGETLGRGCLGGCRALPVEVARARREKGEASVLRFAVPTETVHVADEIRGHIHFEGHDIGDFVILRSDGRATYNFAVVVDDLDMEISHVIRGAGHLSNTPKQALLYDALGAPRPAFAHLPTVLGPDGSKLSKRTGAPGVDHLRAAGYHPDGVVNYLSLLGWSPGEDREVLSRDELVGEIDLARAGASNTVFDPDKLRWMSGQHVQTMPLEELAAAVEPHLDRDRFPVSGDVLTLAVDAIRTRLRTFGEVNEHLALVFADEGALAAGRAELRDSGEEVAAVLLRTRAALGEVDDWEPGVLGSVVRDVGKELGVRGPALFHPLRLALCGVRSGPDVGKVLAALGPARVLNLLDEALEER